MKKILFGLIFTVLLVYTVNADPLFKITFDNAPIGPAPNYYTVGGDEIIPSQCTAIQKIDNPIVSDTVGPEIADVAAAGAGVPFQGGKALRVHSGGTDEGYYSLFSAAFAPGPLTVEYIFSLNTVDIGPTNTASLQYIGGTEWPFGQTFQWMLRIHAISGGGANKLSFWTDKGDSDGMYVNSTNPLTAKTWTHVAAVLDYNYSDPSTSTILLYINGVFQGSTTYRAWGNSFSLGCSSDRGPCFASGFSSAAPAGLWGDHRGMNGYIDALAISTSVLTPGNFVLNTAPVPLTLSASTISKPLGGSATITASGGLAPYNWSFSTTASVDSAAVGYISSTNGASITFNATGIGEADLFCFDSNSPASKVSVHLIVIPTKAPLFPEPVVRTITREMPSRTIAPNRMSWELFE
jgi:hypothetical protein